MLEPERVNDHIQTFTLGLERIEFAQAFAQHTRRGLRGIYVRMGDLRQVLIELAFAFDRLAMVRLFSMLSG